MSAELASEKAEILIVDDTLPNIQLLSSMLRSRGYIVFEADNGPAALSSVQNHIPDLILLDVRMPGMDGYEVCRQLKSNPGLSTVPVIFVSALDEQMDKIQGFAVGGVDYITKPFQIKEVLARVETHLTLCRLQRQLSEQNRQLQQEIAERRRVETALQVANEALEQRVSERTAELVQTNLELKNELQERRRIERERELLLGQLRSQEKQMREILNTVPEGVLLLAPDGEMILANQTAQATLPGLAQIQVGNRLKQLGDRSLESLLSPPPKGLWHEVKNGAHTFEVIARPMSAGAQEAFTPGDDQRQNHWVMVLRDVSEEREIKRHLQQQDRLAAVGQMAAGIAHDFNNILAVILLYAEMGMGMPNMPPRMHERLQTIAEQSQRASELIQQILDFSRSSVLERQSMDLLSFLKEQIKLLERTLPENIQIGFEHGGGDFDVEADPTRMQQAIINLTVNARDAMPDGGELNIRIRRTQAGENIHCVTCGSVEEEGQWICIEISDTGSGIPAEDLPYIFEPFFTTKEPGKGTGLGLAQVYGIAKSHNGHVDVRTEPGKGSTFSLYIPAISAHAAAAPEMVSPEIIQGKGQRIVLVEDEKATLQALLDTLTLINYQVVAIPNGQEALDYIQCHPQEFDLILSDVVMPEVGGIALLRAVRQMGISTPFVLLTGHPLQEEMEKLHEVGLTAWMLKPPRVRQLAEVISQALQ